MDTRISILFFLKRAKVNAKGLVPIFQRITVAGKRIEKSTGKYIDPLKWSVEGSKMKGTSVEARTINSHLDSLKTKVIDAEKDLYKREEAITAETINNILLGVKKKRANANSNLRGTQSQNGRVVRLRICSWYL